MATKEMVVEQSAAAEKAERALPLTGVRVLDLGHVFQGPYAGFMLAMAGAEVIKIESPSGDMSRRRGRDGDYPFRALNGNKKGIVLNLKNEAGRQLLLELSRTADVLLENFAPSVLPRLGLGPEEFLEYNPKLIYCSGSGFGKTGPYADKNALDLTIQAMGGMMSATGERGGRPLKAGLPVADFMSGAHMYGAIMTALFERERTGRGRVVEVSMFEAVFAPLLPSAGHYYASNHVPGRSGNRHVADSYVPFDTFEAADGWIAIVCATDEHWTKLTQAMGRPDLENDEGLKELKGRIDRIEEVTTQIAEWCRTRTRQTISSICEAHRVAASPLQDVAEILNNEHLLARGFLTPQQADTGQVNLPNSAMRYEGSPLKVLEPAPALGQDTDSVLSELLGLQVTEIEKLRRDGAIA